MDAESHGYPFLSTESLSGPSANSSNPASLPPQGMSVLNGGWSDPLYLDISNTQVNAEVSILVGCGGPSHPLIPMFRHTPLVSILHHTLLLSPSTQQPRYPTLKSPSLPVTSESTARACHSFLLRKRTPCARQRSLRYKRFLNPSGTFDLTR
jgi:hypothetical protein